MFIFSHIYENQTIINREGHFRPTYFGFALDMGHHIKEPKKQPTIT